MERWEAVEAMLPKWRHPQQKRRLDNRVKLLTCIILSCALIEHALSITSHISFAVVCLNHTITFEEFARVESVHVFVLVEYSIWLGMMGRFLNMVATFAWNFMDLFIILMSVGLTSLFDRINADLIHVKGEVCNFSKSCRTSF